MANSYSPQDFKLKTPLAFGASASNQVISKPIGLTKDGSLHLRVDVKLSSVAAGAGISMKLQHSSINGDWADLAGANATVAVTGNGTFSMTQAVERATDQVNMPLKKMVRVLITTGAGSAATVDELRVSQGM